MCVCVCLFIDGLYLPSPLPSPALPLKCQGSGSSSSGVRRKRRNHRAKNSIEHLSELHSSELQNGEVSTSTSGQFTHLLKLVPTSWLNTTLIIACAADGGVCAGAVCSGSEVCPYGGPHSWLIPAMLSPPESLLMPAYAEATTWGPAGEIWCHFFAIKPQRWCHSSDGEVTVCRHITTPFYHLRVQTAY